MDEIAHAVAAETNGAPVCANCGAVRRGPWCQECGQHAEATHRSVRRLCAEAFEHLVNADGKIITTLRGLFTHPAALTRGYLAGHRVAQVAPINLFLVILVLFLFVASRGVQVEMSPLTPAETGAVPHYMRWIVPVSAALQGHTSRFLGNLSKTAELFGLFTVPVAALLLWALFAGRRPKPLLYDHLIFALHSLSFQFIVAGVMVVLPDTFDVLLLPLAAVMAAHLFFHMRGTYGGGAAATLARMACLGAGTVVAFGGLLAAWLAVAYAVLWV